ncbi:HNH endonuclease [Fontibacter flavus]|uniref:HNH endonuclease n=1 Tax=Fontibacter flavus TaxID=654838 RepID=A0ABV6FY26_9BACT
MKVNKYGLSRHIPASVRRKVRKNSGFACVVCGSAICQYDHVDPEWTEAKTHNPKNITLLCGTCHDKKTRKILCVSTVKEAMKNPKSLESGLIKEYFDFGKTIPTIVFGRQRFTNTLNLITIDNNRLIYIEKRIENGLNRYFLNAKFFNTSDELLFEIEDNVWYAPTNVGDLEITGNRLIIKEDDDKIGLELQNIPDKEFIIKSLNMFYKGYKLNSDQMQFSISTPSGKQVIAFSKDVEASAHTAINIKKENLILRNVSFHKGEIDMRNSGAEFCYFGKETTVIMG